MDELEALEHLSYIIECDAEGMTSEAKTETRQLIRLFTEKGNLDPELQQGVPHQLREAEAYFKRGHDFYSAAVISHARANRALWKWVLENRERI